MVEAPEAAILAGQINEKLSGRTVTEVIAAQTPHKFAWYYGDAQAYRAAMVGKEFGPARRIGGYIEVAVEDYVLLLGEGINLKYIGPGEDLPRKHQLLIGFDDESCLVVSVRMYGAMMLFPADPPEFSFSLYYNSAKDKPQVMLPEFTEEYFLGLIDAPGAGKKSAKAFLATEQTIPGLGNGVLQDILYNARIHPKTKIALLDDGQKQQLYRCIVDTLNAIYENGGRNSETDLYGRAGGYVPFLSKDTAGAECPRCSSIILKESYMGGSIYYCTGCQLWLK